MRRWAWLGGFSVALGCAPAAAPRVVTPPRLLATAAPSAPPSRAPARTSSVSRHQAAEDLPLFFDQGPLRLAGTLRLPRRAADERVPAVVIVPGSGALSRDGLMRGQLGLGFGFELPVYRSLAEGLAERGYAVYRYDKRSCGRFNDCADNRYPTVPWSLQAVEYSTAEYLADAAAALAAVAAHPAIDPRRVFVVGHSQGGSLVPALMRVYPTLPAGVMLAPPFRPLAALLEQQGERLHWAFTLAGKPEEASAERATLVAAASALRDVEAGTHLGEPILGEPPGVWASWIQLGQLAPELARSLDRPLLVLGGAYDYNVEPADIAAWGALLSGAPGVAHRVRLLPCVTHALNCITEADPTRIEPADIAHEVSPELVAEIARFLDGV